MIYFNFKNYEEFKDIFGFVEHGNGVKSRKNKILLSLYKDRQFFKRHIQTVIFNEHRLLYERYDNRYDTIYYAERVGVQTRKLRKNQDKVRYLRDFYNDTSYKLFEFRQNRDPLSCDNLASLKMVLYSTMNNCAYNKPGCDHVVNLGDKYFYSNLYETDDMNGLCEDGTVNAIRYRNLERDRVFKMKAGKMFNHLMSCNTFIDAMPEQIKRWLSEEFVAEWIQYATKHLLESDFTLHVDDDFCRIYDSSYCVGNFGSCMVDDGQWTFYRDSVQAKAAYLENSDGEVVARCIVFTDVFDEDGKHWRLAERQYSKDSRPELQRQLISALIHDGHIDGYKSVGASCGDARDFVSNDGNSLHDKEFHIACSLEPDGMLSYQDSFKWYDYHKGIAYNHSDCDYDYQLDTTDEHLESPDDHDDDCWSEYNDEYINEYDAVYVETRGDYFYDNQTCDAYVWNSFRGCFDEERCFEEDCIEIHGDMYYAGRDAGSPESHGIYCCPFCEDYFTEREGMVYSYLTGEDYCCESCKELAERKYKEDNGWTYSKYDDEYYESAEDVTEIYVWTRHASWRGVEPFYEKTTISLESLQDLIDNEEVVWCHDAYYKDVIGYDGEPVHIAARDAA